MTTDDQGNFGNIPPFGARTDTDTANIVVVAVNDAPVFDNATFFVNQNAANGSLVADQIATDVENDTITYAITAGNTGGAFAIDPSTGLITVANSAAVVGGPFDLTVVATDNGTPNESDSATITIVVNAPPTISAPIDDAAVFEDATPIVINLGPVFADAEDPDSALAFTVSSNSDPSLFSSINVTGTTLTLTLAPNANGASALTVRATDTAGLFVEEVFSLAVTPVNDAPTLNSVGDVTVNEDAAEQIINLEGISAGAANESGQVVSFVATSDNPGLIPDPTIQYTGGATGTLKFTAVPNAHGTATITLTATDDGGTANGGVNTFIRTFAITVDPVNDVPTLDAIGDVSVDEDSGEGSLALTGISAGPANESGQTVSITASSSNATLIPDPTIEYTGGATGTLRFSPAANAHGTATITVTVADNGGGVNTFVRTFTITVDPVNDAPVLNDVSFTVNELATNGTAVGTVTATDPDNDSITYAITAGNTGGAFAIDPATGAITVANGTAVTGGPFSLTIEATDDGSPSESDTATVTLTVNLAPTTTGIENQTVLEDAAETAVSLADAFADAEDADGDLTYQIVGNTNPGLFDSILVDGNALDLLFTPTANANGSSTVRVRATDTGGLFVESEFVVTVDPVNDAPTLDAVGDVSVNEDGPEQSVNLTGISAGPANESSQGLTITAVSSNPSVVSNPAVQYTAGNSTGTLTFTPVVNASGSATITVTVTDNGGTVNGGVNAFVRTFTVTVGQVADRPVIDIVPTPMLPPVPLKTTPTGAPIGTLLEHATDDDPTPCAAWPSRPWTPRTAGGSTERTLHRTGRSFPACHRPTRCCWPTPRTPTYASSRPSRSSRALPASRSRCGINRTRRASGRGTTRPRSMTSRTARPQSGPGSRSARRSPRWTRTATRSSRRCGRISRFPRPLWSRASSVCCVWRLARACSPESRSAAPTRPAASGSTTSARGGRTSGR